MNAGEVESLYEFCEKKNGFCSIPFVWRYSDTVNDLKLHPAIWRLLPGCFHNVQQEEDA